MHPLQPFYSFYQFSSWPPITSLPLHVSPQGSVLRTRAGIALEGEEMTWVMEEDTQASVKENRGWKGGENDLFMKENYTAFTFLNRLDQNPVFPLTL